MLYKFVNGTNEITVDGQVQADLLAMWHVVHFWLCLAAEVRQSNLKYEVEYGT